MRAEGLNPDLLHSTHHPKKDYDTNQFPFIRDLLKNQPNNTVLLKIYSDAPTFTMQRM